MIKSFHHLLVFLGIEYSLHNLNSVASTKKIKVVRDGNTLILNTRSSQALTQAGIPRSQ